MRRAVWLDLVNDQDVVPDYNGLIVSKVSRVQSESATRPVERVAAKTASPPAPIKAPDLIETNIPETPTGMFACEAHGAIVTMRADVVRV